LKALYRVENRHIHTSDTHVNGGNKTQAKAIGGYTLVELLVAAVVLAVMVAGLVATVRYMRAEQNLDYHRRQARMAINRIFEDGFSNYSAGGYEVTFDKASGDAVATGQKRTFSDFSATATNTNWFNDEDSVNIDCRPNHKRVNAQVSVRVALDSVMVVSGLSWKVPTHLVTATLKWREVGGTGDDTLSLIKRTVWRRP